MYLRSSYFLPGYAGGITEVLRATIFVFNRRVFNRNRQTDAKTDGRWETAITLLPFQLLDYLTGCLFSDGLKLGKVTKAKQI